MFHSQAAKIANVSIIELVAHETNAILKSSCVYFGFLVGSLREDNVNQRTEHTVP